MTKNEKLIKMIGCIDIEGHELYLSTHEKDGLIDVEIFNKNTGETSRIDIKDDLKNHIEANSFHDLSTVDKDRIKRCIRQLEEFQKWRRGDDIEMSYPKDIGIAIDRAIHYIKFLANEE